MESGPDLLGQTLGNYEVELELINIIEMNRQQQLKTRSQDQVSAQPLFPQYTMYFPPKDGTVDTLVLRKPYNPVSTYL